MKTVSFAATLAAFAAASAAFGGLSPKASEELIRNGSFEEVEDGRAVGWPVAKHYSVAERGGMNGTRGIVFENDNERDFRALLTQNVKFEHG